jgi:exodeoxyribonuclease III
VTSEFFPDRIVCSKLGDHSHRVVLTRVGNVNLFGVYFAMSKRKRPLFDFLLNLPDKFLEEPSMIAGDFNTGLPFEDEMGNTFACSGAFRRLLETGWIDAWRCRHPDAREYTWFSRAGEKRLSLRSHARFARVERPD